jgi:hypothetical protein
MNIKLKNILKFRNQVGTYLLIILTLMGCSEGDMETTETIFRRIKDVPEHLWSKLSSKKIYFGHQSVGYNIIDGIKIIMNENPQIKLNIVLSDETDNIENAGFFSHSEIGENGKPDSKLGAFKKNMEDGLGNKVDIAFFKFCYVDFKSNTEVKNIFDQYKKIMIELKEKYPNVAFIHVTSPLTIPQEGILVNIKNSIKRMIGKPVSRIEDNTKRDEFNALLKSEFKSKDPVFDLAQIESTYPENRIAVFSYEGKKYPHLVQNYTDDGGHLNQAGSKIVAEQLLIFLATN